MHDDLDSLAVLAKAASAGDWRVQSTLAGVVVKVGEWPNDAVVAICGSGHERVGDYVANAAYIAAVNPQTFLRLIERLRRAEAVG